MAVEIGVDGTLELGHARKCAASNALLRDLGKEALHQIEPRSAGRREVQMETAMLAEPTLHRLRFVRPVVVEHKMDVEVGLHAPIDALEEADELFGAMPRMALADDEAPLHIERGEQRRGTVALVIVGHRRRTALLQG